MNTNYMVRAALYSLLLLLPFGLQSEPIQPDRPGFSTGTYTVMPGSINVEAGLQSSSGNYADDPDSFVAPLLNLRAGLTPSTELNFIFDGWMRERDENGTEISTSDLLVGVKHRLISRKTYNISLLGFVSLPVVNSADFSYFSPFVGFLWDYEVSRDISAFGTFQIVSVVEGGQRLNNFQPAVGLSFSHTNRLSTYIEYYRDMSLGIDVEDSDMFDAGVTYLLNDDIQLDLNAGVSIDRILNDFIGAGIAIQFP